MSGRRDQGRGSRTEGKNPYNKGGMGRKEGRGGEVHATSGE